MKQWKGTFRGCDYQTLPLNVADENSTNARYIFIQPGTVLFSAQKLEHHHASLINIEGGFIRFRPFKENSTALIGVQRCQNLWPPTVAIGLH